MAPKGKAPKSGGEDAAVAAAVALLATPEKALEAFTTLAEQAATEDGMIALCESMGEVLPPAVLALEAALGATDDEAATSAATGAAKVIGALGGGSAAACSGVVRADGVLSALVGLCGGVGIEQLDASAPAAVLLEAVCAALKELMRHSVGRLYARKAAVCAPLLALLSSTLAAHEAVQTEASLALSHACESALLRTQLHMHVPALVSLCHSLIQGKRQAPADDHKGHVLQVLGGCLHDASLRPALLDAGVVGVAVKALATPKAEEGGDAAEGLRLAAAATLAIAARSPEGRGVLLQLDAPAALLALLRGGPAPAEGGEAPPPPPPSALTAAACLAVAHLALLPPAAEALAKLGAVPLLLPSLAPPAADADADAAATARANASTALQHLSLARPQLMAEAGAAAAVGGLLGQSPPLPPSLVVSALEVVASCGRSGAARDAMCAEGGGESEGEGGAPSCLRAVVAEMLAAQAEMRDAQPDAAAGGAGEAAMRLETALTALTALAPADAACRLMRGAPAAPPAAPPGAAAEAEAGAGAEAAAEQGGEGEGEGEGVGVAASPFATVLAVLAARPSAALCRAAASCFAAFASCDAACAAALVQLGVLGQLLTQAEEGGAAQASRAAVNSVCAAHGPAQLWNTGLVPPELLVGDGFYAVGADGRFGDLEEQRREGAAQADASETLLLDSAADPGLAQCLAAARTEVEALGAEVSPRAAAALLARMVAARMGGAVPYAAYEHYDNSAELGDLRHASGCRVVHLGALRRGRARQRALLFKALADAVRVVRPCLLNAAACLGAMSHLVRIPPLTRWGSPPRTGWAPASEARTSSTRGTPSSPRGRCSWWTCCTSRASSTPRTAARRASTSASTSLHSRRSPPPATHSPPPAPPPRRPRRPAEWPREEGRCE